MATGIIAEFNPFHNGHKYLLEKAKDENGVVAVMSGSFVQRGDIAITDKWTRSRMALDNGADGVFIGEFPGDLMYDEVERKLQRVKDRISEMGEDPERVTFSKVYIPYFSGLARKFIEFDKKIEQLDEAES